MSNAPHFPLETRSDNEKRFVARFKGNGTGAVDNTLNKGAPCTVARTGVGVFVVTFLDAQAYVDIIHVNAAVMAESAALWGVNAVTTTSISNPFASTLTLTLQVVDDAGSAADPGTSDNDWVSFEVVARDVTS